MSVKQYPLYDYHTGKHVVDYIFAGEPQNGDKIQPGGVGNATYTIIRCWEAGKLVIKLTRLGVRQAGIIARGGSVVSNVTEEIEE